jgi:XPB/Ssl2-like helicase family protein
LFGGQVWADAWVLMRLGDYLETFSIEDLRELATRRGVNLSQNALKGRQTLVRTLAATLERYENVYVAVARLNAAELTVLQYLLQAGRRLSLTGVCAGTGLDAAAAKAVLDSLRLWGLVFPEGDWEHLVVPTPTQIAGHYLPSRLRMKKEAAPPWPLHLPPVETASGVACAARPGSLGWDVAELLARVARSRLKLTQAQRMNRRDLKAMEPGLGIQVTGYSTFLSMLAGGLGLLAETKDEILTVSEAGDLWLAQAEPARTGIAVSTWQFMRGYPESATLDPAEYEYLPGLLPVQRARIMELVRDLDPSTESGTVSVTSLGQQLAWMAPLSFEQWDSSQDATLVTARLVRSLYWMGIVAVDDGERPRHVRLTPLGARVLDKGGPDIPELVPEERRFFLQPNAEAFAPPNMAPRTLFHLRRITGEKKGGAAGMFPITAESIRRALDSGLSVGGILSFLEQFSRTGLPGAVRSLVETTSRQHGRIRLIPTGYVVVTDDGMLMEELRKLKTVSPLLGASITERVSAVETGSVSELMRTLRSRGYAPLNQAETGTSVPLPDDPGHGPPLLTEALSQGAASAPAGELDWSVVDKGGTDGEPSGERVVDRREIVSLLVKAEEQDLEVEIEYANARRRQPQFYTVWAYSVDQGRLEAYSVADDRDRVFDLSGIQSVRLTGASCEWEDEFEEEF